MEPDTSNLDFKNFTSSKIDKFIKSNLKKILKREGEIREWIEKFFSDKWYNEELERIKEFESLADKIEGFQDDPEIQHVYKKAGVDGVIKTYIEEAPNVEKSKVTNSIKNVILNYSEKIHKLAEKANLDLKNFNIQGLTKKKQILKLISEKFSSYWSYLGFLRNSYVDIFNLAKMFDYSLTIQFLKRTILVELYDIDKQFYFRDRIFGLKNITALFK